MSTLWTMLTLWHVAQSDCDRNQWFRTIVNKITFQTRWDDWREGKRRWWKSCSFEPGWRQGWKHYLPQHPNILFFLLSQWSRERHCSWKRLSRFSRITNTIIHYHQLTALTWWWISDGRKHSSCCFQRQWVENWRRGERRGYKCGNSPKTAIHKVTLHFQERPLKAYGFFGPQKRHFFNPNPNH